ncbi:MAG: alpha/beta fold hydrolase [Flavobacteriaceae bacterium]|nr:alpha/beta fold hydrolase [Flavobacteriaceae bacterium]
MKKIKRKIRKLLVKLIGSPIKIDNKARGRKIKQIAPLPKEIFWDDSVNIHKTKGGIEFVQTPSKCFRNLPNYNFNENYYDLNRLKIHYVDAGPAEGKILLLLHGQPVWSYLYRTMIHDLVSKGYRCIAPDLMGMGKSDKPISEKYHTYDTHCENILSFIKGIKLNNITLFCQDWGSLIGLRIAGENPGLFVGIIAANAELPKFTEETNPLYIPETIKINTKIKSFTGAMAYYSLGGFARGSFQAWILYCLTAPMVDIKSILKLSFSRNFKKSKQVIDAYVSPFPSFIYMAGPRTLPSMNAGITGQTLKAIEGLKKFKKPFLSLIGLQDKLLGTPRIQKKWIKIVPGAKGQDHEQFKEANHFIQEDIGEIMADRVHKFIIKNKI